MDEFELIRWLDVLVETGMIRRWQQMFGNGGIPFTYVIDGRLYSRERAVRLVRHFEAGYAPSWRNTPLRILIRQRIWRARSTRTSGGD